MILFCNKSGLSIELPTFIGGKFDWNHPIFSLPLSKLISLSSLHAKRKLSKQDSRLLCLAMFDATKLIKWREPASIEPCYQERQHENVMKAIPKLVKMLDFTATCPSWPKSQASYFPVVVIDGDNNKTLSVINEACDLWLASVSEYYGRYAAEKVREKKAKELRFLDSLKAFSSRKPTRYIRALSHHIIDSLPAKLFKDRADREFYRYIIEYSGVNNNLERSPDYDITAKDCSYLMDLITDNLSLDDLHIWQAYKAVKNLLESGGYNAYDVSLWQAESSQDNNQDQDIELVAKELLGEKPKDFINAMAYEAKLINLINELKSEKSKSGV